MSVSLAHCSWLAALLLLACSSEESPGSSGDPVSEAGAAGASAAGAPAGGDSGSQAGPSPAEGGSAGAAVIEGGRPAEAGAGTAGQAVGGSAPDELTVLELSGATTQVHDPHIVKEGDTYYLFSTGKGISVRTSKDLRVWKGAGSVFPSKPSWVTTTAPDDPNHLWAPEVRFFGGQFHLYYSASKFGSNQSCIGHATRASLASGSWADQGDSLICSNQGGVSNDYNAIDPSPFEDEDGKLWLAFGSFWSGLKLIRLDEDGRRDGPDLFSLATRPNKAVEAAQLVHHGEYYYLFESVDSCCQGASSTYKIMVGRSKNVSGPYVDAEGASLVAGGGTLVLEGAGRWRGPGHNAVLVDEGRYYNVYHAYDAQSSGVPNLRIAEMTWSDEGWPVSAGP
ncbi:MAG: arabinan endo-1,5-alpha-L-arabinosidase [Myxococcales bacterium]|nr:MAG: arabinan endo-1,5-alpha-L-arabinosidase [Myxococcales bacterium]